MIKAAIVNDTGGKGHFGCDLVMARLREELARAGGTEVWSHPVGVDWQPLENELLKRPPVDVVIVNGEGSIHHSASRDRARYLPAIGPFARHRMRVPAFLINATITDIDQTVADDLREFTAIYVRDGGSRRELKAYGMDAKSVPDLTIGADLDRAGSRRGVCVTDSVVKDAADALQSAASLNGWSVRPMVSREKSRWPWSRKAGYRDFAKFLSSHDLVVTGRYHTVTLCLATETPFVAVESNTPKISWLLDDVFGSQRRLIAPLDLQRLQVADYNTWSDVERAAVDRTKSAARRGAADMFANIASRFKAF